MADKVQANTEKSYSSLFHRALIKLLIIKELKKRKRTWDSFIKKMDIQPKTPITSKIKNNTLSKDKGEASSSKAKRKREDIMKIIETPNTSKKISVNEEGSEKKKGKC